MILHNIPSSLGIQDIESGLFNKTFFEYIFQNEWARGTRKKKPIGLAIVRLLNMQKDFLQDFAGILVTGARREIDIIARIEDDLFVLLLPETDRHGTGEVIGRIMELLKDFSTTMQTELMKVCIGMDCDSPHRDSYPQDLYNNAREALKKASELGENQVLFYSELEELI